jgi:hypothetical protein
VLLDWWRRLMPQPDERDDLPVMPVRVFYRALLIRGFTPPEAGNLTAWRMGLEPTAKGWTLKQITELMARRWEEEQRTR